MNRSATYPDLDFESVDRIREVQAALLRQHARRCARRSPYYRRLFRRLGADPGALTPETLHRLPATGKEDFARENEAFLAVPRERIADLVLSSGTTGAPTPVAYTERDLRRLAYNEAQAFRACGIGRGDVVLLTCTMDRCFVAGLAYFLGVRAAGAAAIRNGHGSLASHAHVIRTLRPTAVVGVPSFLRKLGEYLAGQGEPPSASSVRRLVCIGEPVRDRALEPLKLGRDLRALWKASVHSTYASSECVSTFCECGAGPGGHASPDLVLVEILDARGTPVPDGEVGEVTLTPLGVEGMPLLRFRTGDESFRVPGSCACGRQSPRLGPILGRRRQMLKVRGTTLYPQAVFAALDEIPGVGEFCLEVERDDLSDRLTVRIAERPGLDLAAIGDALQARLRVRPELTTAPEAEIRARVYDPESRKPVRVFIRPTRRTG